MLCGRAEPLAQPLDNGQHHVAIKHCHSAGYHLDALDQRVLGFQLHLFRLRHCCHTVQRARVQEQQNLTCPKPAQRDPLGQRFQRAEQHRGHVRRALPEAERTEHGEACKAQIAGRAVTTKIADEKIARAGQAKDVFGQLLLDGRSEVKKKECF